MRTASILEALVLGGFLTLVHDGHAYEVDTHTRMTEEALTSSTMPLALAKLGILRLGESILDNTRVMNRGIFASEEDGAGEQWDPTYSPSCIRVGPMVPITIVAMVRRGAFCEDATESTNERPFRYGNHFYDPTHSVHKFDGYARKYGVRVPYTADFDSQEWGGEVKPISGQMHSYTDFKRAIVTAMTSTDLSERNRQIGLALRSLGQVAHLIEDLAQPQHTRNDGHTEGSPYEEFTNLVRSRLNYGGYQVPNGAINRLEDIWSTSGGTGLADFSNRNFVSAGTNFRNRDIVRPNKNFPLPEPPKTLEWFNLSDVEADKSCKGNAVATTVDGKIAFGAINVNDRLNGASISNKRGTAFGLFYNGVREVARSFTQNRFNFCAAQDILIPRAVGYVRAFFDWTFRGDIEISSDEVAPFSVINLDVNGCKTICGFTSLSTKLRNSTAAGESIGRGTLRAIVRFHVNSDLTSTLDGSPETPHFRGYEGRLPKGELAMNEMVAVSEPITIDGLSSDVETQFNFDFARSPIPIWASDSHLQIVFVGVLGSEQEAIAIGAEDIAEPAFLTFINAEDYIPIYGADGKFIRMDPYVDPNSLAGDKNSIKRLNVTTEIDGVRTGIARVDVLRPGDFSRIALLLPRGDFIYDIDYTWEVSVYPSPIQQEFGFEAPTLELDSASKVLTYFPGFTKLRLNGPESWLFHPKVDGFSVYWTSGYDCDTASCTPEDVTVGEQVRRYPPLSGSAWRPMRFDF